ncbi:triple tyrosine motif-containing protein [Siphonobacter sp. BAB-5385]|uniref:ligand-binding sensor domain-containing protein n=1 Tax=Siphonobacter sp. BAB-5385 TaxID=1864822 RepID=UPI0015952D30|nr:sensor histidine kinase [Siphonobacter sp. BAB-5385]
MYRLFACLLLFAWLSNCLLMGQSLKYRFEHITVNEGLSHSDAMTVIEDHKGFLWIGTNKGIDQYDGYRLKKYTLPQEQTGTTFSNRIRSLRIGADGRLWTGGEGMSLYYYDASTDQFRKVKPGPTIDPERYTLLTDIRTLAIDKRGTVWVGTRQGGVLGVRVDQSGIIETLEQIKIPNQGGNWAIEKLTLDTQGRLWIGALGGGLWYYTIPSKLASGQAEPFVALPIANVRGLYLDQQANLWFADDTRVYWLNLAGKSLQPQVIAGPFEGIGSVYRDSFGQLWVGTNQGLHYLKFAAASKQTPPVPQDSGETFLPEDANEHSINSSRIHEIYEDRFHNLWLAASAGGINKLNLRSKPFHHLHRLASQSPTLSSNYINAVISDQDMLWIGTRNGISQYNRSSQTYRNFLSLPANMNGMDVSTLYKASNGSIWAGTRYGGLWKKNIGETGFQAIANPSKDRPWTITSIESIAEDPFHTIWVATYNRGLYRYSLNGNLLAHYHPQNNSLPTNRLTCLLADEKTLWISTRDNGVLQCQLDQDSLRVQKQYVHDPADVHSLQVNYAWPLQKDTKGNLWIGTIGGGLHQLNLSTGQMQRWLAQVSETDVESILLDEKGHVWIGGEGLYDFDPVSRQVIHYDVTDGLQSNSFKVGAAFRGADQTLYWGGANGITFFKPSLLTQNRIAPLVRITGLRIHNQHVGVGDTLHGRVLIDKPLDEHPHIEISHAENDFSIEFVGLDYISPSKHQYKYRLVGFNADWIQTTPGQRLVSFTNLPAGTYRFEVKARNADGIWSEKAAVLVFNILPPWYQSPWAYLLYTGVLLLALLLYRKVTLHQQKLKNEVHLKEILYQKEKELTDLKLNFFTQVSHELRTPLTLIMGPVEELMQGKTAEMARREQLLLVHRQAQKLNNLVNELLDFRKTESGNAKLQAQRADIVAFLKELFVLFSFRAEEQQINYRFESSHSELFMAFDPAKMETVISNLLSNALKFTPAGETIRLVVTLEQEQHVHIVVEDTGYGIAPEELDRIFDPYYQAHQSGSFPVKGTGIGLLWLKVW